MGFNKGGKRFAYDKFSGAGQQRQSGQRQFTRFGKKCHFKCMNFFNYSTLKTQGLRKYDNNAFAVLYGNVAVVQS